MAKINILFALAISTLALSTLYAQARTIANPPKQLHHLSIIGIKHIDHTAPTSSPTNVEYTLAPVLGPTVDYLDTCLAKLTEKCEKEIFFGNFRKEAISEECCEKMVDTGRHCYTEMLKATTSFPVLSEGEKEVIEKWGGDAWTLCSLVADAL